MSMLAINTTQPVMRLRDEMDRLFEDCFGTVSPAGLWRVWGRSPFPPIDVRENGEAFIAEAELPGVNMDDVEVYVVGDELTIKGEYKDQCGDDVTYHRRERGVGSFRRVLRLPVEVDADKVKASFRNGLLTITLPKARAALPRKIEVKG